MRAHLPTHSNDNTGLFQPVTLKHKELSVSDKGGLVAAREHQAGIKYHVFWRIFNDMGKG